VIVDADGLAALRRDFHRHAETGWTEFRTAAKVATTLRSLGFEVATGRSVVADDRAGVPSPERLAAELERAIAQGADPDVAREFEGGYTGVVGSLRGTGSGPVVALRFDMDANSGPEATEPAHRPARDGFASVNAGAVHSCGHDAHTAIGLGVAEGLAQAADRLRGEVRLIFQPAEEGLRGGRAMASAGVVDGVDVLLGCHVGVQARSNGELIAGYRNILASEKLDAEFTGRSAHAGIDPHEGRNALLAAAIATQNLLAISRHGDGETRVNVGAISGGEARNAIPAHAVVHSEVRADSTPILEYMVRRAHEVVRAAAAMCDVEVELRRVGGAGAASSDPDLAAVVEQVASGLDAVARVRSSADFKGSDDVSELMAAVQRAGGSAVYFGVGTDLADGHHTPTFDIDESALDTAVAAFLGCLRSTGTIAEA
jgi:aminobenzoyl-glutamate utilization protein A